MEVVDPVSGKSFFRKRLRRYDEIGHARELTFSCYQRFQFLGRDRTRTWFLEALDAARREQPFDLWAYVIMPEHVHLLVYPRGDGIVPAPESSERNSGREASPTDVAGSGGAAPSVATFLRVLKEPVARKAISYLKAHAPQWLPRITVKEGGRVRHRFWQPGGGYDRNIFEGPTLRAVIDYLHANPVRRSLTDKPEAWEWSSARWYAGIRPVALDIDPSVLDFLGGTP